MLSAVTNDNYYFIKLGHNRDNLSLFPYIINFRTLKFFNLILFFTVSSFLFASGSHLFRLVLNSRFYLHLPNTGFTGTYHTIQRHLNGLIFLFDKTMLSSNVPIFLL